MSGRKNRGKPRNRKGQSRRPRRRAQEKAGLTPTFRPPLLQKARPKDQETSLDGLAPDRQDRENGDTAPSPEPSALRADEPARPEPVGAGSPEPSGPPRPPSQIVRPYSIEAVLNPLVAIQFSEWCQKQGGCELGIGIVEDYVGVADGDIGWHLRPGGDLTGQVSGTALKDLLKSVNPPSLIIQNMDQVLPLAQTLDIPARQLLNLVVGDTSKLLDLLGRGRDEPPYWSSPADAAYDAFVQERHYATQAPSFYRAVSVLRARQRAFYGTTEGEWGDGIRWTLKFQDLFLRVVAHFSREPVLLMAFADEQDPLAKVMALLEIETEEQAMALIIWTIIGFDTPALSACSPEYYPHLPHTGQQELMSLCTRKLPVLANRYLTDREDFTRDRHLTTLYGLHVGYRKTVSEAVADRYFRSEQELLDVCATAFWNDEEIVVAGTGWGGRTSSVNGWVTGQKSEWHDIISQVGQAVDSHLSVKPASSLFWVDD